METEKMQKLVGRNTYTPGDASQVPCSVAVSLNREETLSEHGLKPPSNSLDGNLLVGQLQGLQPTKAADFDDKKKGVNSSTL